jgi:hypothetical protein
MNTTETILNLAAFNEVAKVAINQFKSQNATIKISDNGETSMMLDITASGDEVPSISEPFGTIEELESILISRLTVVF